MKRRSFLAMLGFAPAAVVASKVPAIAKPIEGVASDKAVADGAFRANVGRVVAGGMRTKDGSFVMKRYADGGGTTSVSARHFTLPEAPQTPFIPTA
ncbi:hypothetical protein [Phyllobacterium leguminum]|uniref:Secreted protein n=1 Tax=Phyllobacterium leguminum TaxID=314237 RepID=A0A318T5Q0_9HYPH|nr:hypothetical protein [Phyllobacterium leguminum]PYE89604.1 hypothetical protein C7477_103112 [Phyllobacterium leguminum]